MTAVPNHLTPAPTGVLLFLIKHKKRVSKAIALVAFSTVFFLALENTFFRWVFGMMLFDSLLSRTVALPFNIILGLFWGDIEKKWIKKPITDPLSAWLQRRQSQRLQKMGTVVAHKYEEGALILIKLIVNICVYATVGIITGHMGAWYKVVVKGLIVSVAAYIVADWVKYWLVTFTEVYLFDQGSFTRKERFNRAWRFATKDYKDNKEGKKRKKLIARGIILEPVVEVRDEVLEQVPA